ncbi:hypothetical protein CRYUN_Cryun19dG0120200 [Craigia yunnanensis]
MLERSDKNVGFRFKEQFWEPIEIPNNSFYFRASISPTATSVAVDGPTTSTKASKSLPFRVGHGFDLHRLEPGYPLIIGGIDIPHDRGCETHSDGDVLLHCVVDAILGALGLPDIGQIFPDSYPKWKGAASSVFINEAAKTHERVESLGESKYCSTYCGPAYEEVNIGLEYQSQNVDFTSHQNNLNNETMVSFDGLQFPNRSILSKTQNVK